MRIGIDIDGVLCDAEKWQLDYGSKYFYEKFGKNIIDFEAYENMDMFGVSEKEDIEFWAEYFEPFSKFIRVRELASEVIKKLKNDGNEIYIITARGSFLNRLERFEEYEISKSWVIDWLKENEIYYDKLLFTTEDKLDTCLANRIDLMIEDKSKNMISISTKIPVICYHANHNKNCNNENIRRCYSWYDIYRVIKEEFK